MARTTTRITFIRRNQLIVDRYVSPNLNHAAVNLNITLNHAAARHHNARSIHLVPFPMMNGMELADQGRLSGAHRGHHSECVHRHHVVMSELILF